MSIIRSISFKLLSLAFVLFSLAVSVKAEDNKDKGKKREQNQENVVMYSTSELVFLEQVSKEFEMKVSKAISNSLMREVELIKVVDSEGNVILETTEVKDVPANAEKLMEYRKIAFYIVNL